MISNSLRQRTENIITVIAGDDQKNYLKSRRLSLGRKLRQKVNILKSFAILFLFGLLFVQLCLVSAVQATVPEADELDWVCREAASQLVAGSGERRLDNVAVYFFRPRGYSQKRMDDRTQKEARIVAQAMEDVLTNRSEFTILNRNSDVWAAVLIEENNRGTLNNRDILDVGTGFGADWIVTGEYWFGNNSCFHLRTRLFNGKSGETLASALVKSPFVSSHHSVQPLVGFVAFMLLVAGGGTLYLIRKKRKIRRYEQVDVGHENKTQQTQSSILAKKIKAGSRTNFKANPKEQLMAKSVNPKHYQVDSANHNYTKPRTWGAFAIPDDSATGTKKKFRLGNYPVRQRELEKEFGLVEFIALFEKRDDAKALIDLLENE